MRATKPEIGSYFLSSFSISRSPLPISHPGEGGPAPRDKGGVKLIPAPAPRAYPRPTSSPRGSHPEVCRWWGWGRRLRVGLRSTPGRLRGTALGVLRPLCEELAGTVGGITPSSHARRDATRPASDRKAARRSRDHPMHETKESASALSAELASKGLAAKDGLDPISAARRLKNADERSATGRAEGGSILPRRILAQWKRPDTPAPRGAPLPLIRQPPRGSVGGVLARHSVMLGLVPSIHVLNTACDQRRRGWSPQGRP